MELFSLGYKAAGEELFVRVRELVEADIGEPLVERLVKVDVAVRATTQAPRARFRGRSDEDLGARADRGGPRARARGNLFLAKVELDPLDGTSFVRTRDAGGMWIWGGANA